MFSVRYLKIVGKSRVDGRSCHWLLREFCGACNGKADMSHWMKYKKIIQCVNSAQALKSRVK